MVGDLCAQMHTEPVHAGPAGLVSTLDTGLCTIHRGRTLTAQAHPCATTDLPLALELPVCSQRARSDGEGVDGGRLNGYCLRIVLRMLLIGRRW